MVLQTELKTRQTLPAPGVLGTLDHWRITQAQNGRYNKSGDSIPFGVLVRPDPANPGCVLPLSATGQVILGVVYRNPSRALIDSETPNEVPNDDLIDVLAKGAVIVHAESASLDAPVYVRHTVDGANTQIGAVASAAGTGLDLVPNARFISSLYLSPDRAMIYLDVI